METPQIVYCKDCKYITYWRSGEAAKKFGKAAECSRGILLCPEDYDFCSKGELQLRCPKCRMRFDEFPNFCPRCGEKLKEK